MTNVILNIQIESEYQKCKFRVDVLIVFKTQIKKQNTHVVWLHNQVDLS